MFSLLRESSCANGHAGWLHTNCFANGRRHQILYSGVASNMVSVPPVTSHSLNYLMVVCSFFFFTYLYCCHCVVRHGQGRGYLSVRNHWACTLGSSCSQILQLFQQLGIVSALSPRKFLSPLTVLISLHCLSSVTVSCVTARQRRFGTDSRTRSFVTEMSWIPTVFSAAVSVLGKCPPLAF